MKSADAVRYRIEKLRILAFQWCIVHHQQTSSRETVNCAVRARCAELRLVLPRIGARLRRLLQGEEPRHDAAAAERYGAGDCTTRYDGGQSAAALCARQKLHFRPQS